MDLKGKVALVTGASSGIGKATAIALAMNGASVIINYKSDSKSARLVLEECDRFSSKNLAVKADITSEPEVRRMFKQIVREYHSLDILVNNAGIFDETDGLTNLAAFEKLWKVNFLGQSRIIKNSLNIMKEGKIINISSVHGRLGHGRAGAAGYSALKAALDSYTKNLAKELAPKILVNAIAPGQTLTRMWGNMTKDEEKELAANQLINRFILPEEISDAILFVLKNDAVCGEILTIDGGMSLKTLQ